MSQDDVVDFFSGLHCRLIFIVQINPSSNIELMAYFEPMWHCYPLTLPVRGTPHWPTLSPMGDFSTEPTFYHAQANATRRRESDLRPTYPEYHECSENTKKFFLQIALYNFVAANPNIAFRDPRLTAWRLSLPSEYRQFIPDEANFFHFMQRHPAIELLFQQAWSMQMPQVLLQTSHKQFKGNFTQKVWPCPADCIANVADSFQTIYDRPRMERPTIQESVRPQSSARGVMQGLPDFSLDLEETRCHQQGKHQPFSQISAAPNRWNNSAHGINFQSEWQPFQIELQPKLYGLIGDEVKSSKKTGLQVPPKEGHFQISSEGNKEDISPEHSIENMKGDSRHVSLIQEDSSLIFAVQESAVAREAQFVSEAAASSSNTCIVEQKISTADKCTSTMPCVASSEIMVSTPFTKHSSAFTQTEELLKADKTVLTELHMSDLDDVVKEFSKFTVDQEVARKKEESPHHPHRKQCDCVGRAQKAELSVLALQYYMYRQHCSNSQLSTQSPATILDVVQKLESDYKKMRDEILAGIPLDHLKPLTIDCDWRNPRVDWGKSKSTSMPVSCENSVTFKANTPEENQSGACKELNTSEAWYDAEEELYPVSVFAEGKEQSEEMSNVGIATELSKEEEMASGLDVPNIANNVNEKSLGVSSTPTPRAPFVPQQYGTMAGFDTLMAELTRLHPGVAKRSIVGALKELWDIYQSDLCPLPLSTIRQMTSNLLNKPANVMPP
ncbi:RNA-binding protein 44 isoform X2 [Hippocampus zosterae]|uniref:RNA-binding protein 44 isoform X2 n=1 Tax=Hippocampus zosterae TaxID=109293 RepID=UPI00223E76BE|nr:RNA-binding protein 44 isoform X2 [Hippocampus zosterae]